MKRRWRLIVVALILLWLVIAGVSAAIGYHQAGEAQTVLNSLEARGTSAASDAQSVSDLRRASHLLDRSNTALSHPLMQPLRLLPVAGRQLSSAIALTDSGSTMTDVAADALEELPSVVLSPSRGESLQKIGALARSADQRLAPLDLGPTEGLAGPLFDARQKAAETLTVMQDASGRGGAAVDALASLYSTDGRYLVLAANSGEMRAGSGMWLSAGLLETGPTGLDLGEMTTVGALPDATQPEEWPPEVEALWGWIGKQSDFRNLMMSPRFDVSAPLAKQVWESTGGETVDGVIVIDPLFLQTLMTATGPVAVGSERFDADNVLQELLIDQYRGVATSGSTAESQAARRNVLSTIARRSFAALNNASADPLKLLSALNDSSTARHVLVWSADASTNANWLKAEVGGTLGPNSLMLSSINVGGNKLDQFVFADVEMTTAVVDGRRRHTMVVSVKNTAPTGLPFYVNGPSPASELAPGEYQGLATFNLPGDATNIALSGGNQTVARGPDGPTEVISQSVQVARGATKELVLTFDRPVEARTLLVEPSTRVLPNRWAYGSRRFDDRHSEELIFPAA